MDSRTPSFLHCQVISHAPDNPLIVQSDHTVLVEVDSPRYLEARDALLGFAELVKSPEHVHTYRITPLSIWNARAAGHEADVMVGVLTEYARYPPPTNVLHEVRDFAERYGRLRLVRDGLDQLLLRCDDSSIAERIAGHRETSALLTDRHDASAFRIAQADRGRIKRALVKAGFPAEDVAGYTAGEPLEIGLRTCTVSGEAFALRPYQHDAADAFHAAGGERGGSGVVVLPCGAGKTIVGMACMQRVGASTLILTTSTTTVRQWIAEILE